MKLVKLLSLLSTHAKTNLKGGITYVKLVAGFLRAEKRMYHRFVHLKIFGMFWIRFHVDTFISKDIT